MLVRYAHLHRGCLEGFGNGGTVRSLIAGLALSITISVLVSCDKKPHSSGATAQPSGSQPDAHPLRTSVDELRRRVPVLAADPSPDAASSRWEWKVPAAGNLTLSVNAYGARDH